MNQGMGDPVFDPVFVFVSAAIGTFNKEGTEVTEKRSANERSAAKRPPKSNHGLH